MKRLFSIRQVNSGLLILLFLGVQFAVLPVGVVMAFTNPSITQAELMEQILPIQAIAFLIGTVLAIILGGLHQNKNRIERGPQTDIPVTIVWIIGGVVLAYAAQLIAASANVYLLGNPVESENTNQVMDMIRNAPFMILVVAMLGPILEEYVFRRAIFSEIYEVFPGSSRGRKVVAFLVAGLVSGLIFAIAHWDFTHILVYLSMSYTFSFLYVMSGRLLVPVVVHILMNGLVVGLNLMLSDYIEDVDIEGLQETAGMIFKIVLPF